MKIEFSKLISQSIETVKKNRMLWVWGMIAAAFAGTSFNFRGNGFSDTTHKTSPHTTPSQNVHDSVNNVLGVATQMGHDMSEYFAHVSPIFWIAVALGILTLIIFIIAFFTFMRNWSITALLAEADTAIRGKDVTLEKGTQAGLKKWWTLFGVQLLLAITFFGVSFACFVAVAVLIALPPLRIIGYILIPVYLIGAICGLIYFIVCTSIAALVVVFEDYKKWGEYVDRSYAVTNKYFWNALILGLINTGFGCGVQMMTYLAILIVGGSIALLSFFGFYINPIIGIVMGIISGIVITAVLISLIFVQGLLQAFKATNWVLFYQQLLEAEKK